MWPRSQDLRSHCGAGYPEATSHVLWLLHKPKYLPIFQQHSPQSGQPPDLMLLRFQNVEATVGNSSSLWVFLSHRDSVRVAEQAAGQ